MAFPTQTIDHSMWHTLPPSPLAKSRRASTRQGIGNDRAGTGEHGDGHLRAEYVKEQYPETYELMVQIKQIYDPMWLMNPGVKLQRP